MSQEYQTNPNAMQNNNSNDIQMVLAFLNFIFEIFTERDTMGVLSWLLIDDERYMSQQYKFMPNYNSVHNNYKYWEIIFSTNDMTNPLARESHTTHAIIIFFFFQFFFAINACSVVWLLSAFIDIFIALLFQDKIGFFWQSSAFF